MGTDPPGLCPVPCIICGRPSTPEPSQYPVCSACCDAQRAGEVALIVDLLLAVDREEQRRTRRA